jgi:hypothetical protein
VVEEDGAVHVEHPRGLCAFVDDSAELLEQPRGLQRELSVVFVDVDLSPLRSSARRRIGLVDGGGDSVEMQHARERQPAEAGADDRDRGVRHAAQRASLGPVRPGH